MIRPPPNPAIGIVLPHSSFGGNPDSNMRTQCALLFDELLVRPDYATARADLIDGICAFRIWTRLGWQEVKRRYRRTVFGPFWATLSISAFIGGMVFIWAPLFKTDVSSYLPFMCTGMLVWTFAI